MSGWRPALGRGRAQMRGVVVDGVNCIGAEAVAHCRAIANGGSAGFALHRGYFSLAYSALAAWRMGMSGSASFQRAKKSW